MATGIVSTGTFLLGPSWLSRALLVIASAGLVVLSVALVIRLARFRPDVVADIRAPGRVAVAAWVAVAAAFLARLTRRSGLRASGPPAASAATTSTTA